ncbi:hypothetical protein ACP57Q_004374, partial [Salmonella enterica subsp. enterica serovar Bareilly]
KKSINNLNAITATTTTPINVSITLTPVINIEHNISCVHRLRGPQGVSAAPCRFSAPFSAHTPEKRP